MHIDDLPVIVVLLLAKVVIAGPLKLVLKLVVWHGVMKDLGTGVAGWGLDLVTPGGVVFLDDLLPPLPGLRGELRVVPLLNTRVGPARKQRPANETEN